MKKLEPLPPMFRRLQQIGGVLEFIVFEEAEGTEDEIAAAMCSTLSEIATVNTDALRSIGYRRITQREFFGDWYDLDRKALIRCGDWKIEGGKELHNPRFVDIGDRKIISGGGSIPDAGSGGQFAFAFTDPPYKLRAPYGEVQVLFDQICGFLMPPGFDVDILDWSSDRLPDVSDYFVDGMEWWGVFLFSVYVSGLKRLTIIAGSSTD
ncbi:hypothetical protein [Paraburkholderia sp.]|uniref:hypothetical protein n=1 Tax=Paraburkholderia sp. TaxID=1926495 RepID=UPI003D6E104E